MALQLSQAVGDGIRRTLSRTGALLFVGFLCVQFGTQATVATAVASSVPTSAGTQSELSAGLVLPISGSAALALFAVLLVSAALFFVVIARAMVQAEGELSTLPAGATRRLGRTGLRVLIGGIVVSVSVFVGTLFFVVPGLFLATSFIFTLFTISVEDRSVIGGLKESWALARGSRLKLFALVLLTTVVGGVLGGVAPLLYLVGIPVASDVVVPVLTSVFLTPYYGIIAASYLQLRDSSDGAGRESSETVSISQTAEA